MSPKENALRLLRFDNPERVVSGLPTFDCSYYGVNHEPYGGGPGGHEAPVGTRWHDIWQVGWRKELDGVMGFAIEHPLADLARDAGCLARYTFPDPDDERLCGRVQQRAEQARQEGAAESMFLAGSHRETLWERCYNLVGMDNLMMAFVDAPNAVRELLRRVMDFQLGIAKHYLAAGVSCARLGDDLGSQRALLFSRGILEEFFVPEYRRLTSLYKQHGVIIGFHSCGHVEPILDVFMDLGVDTPESRAGDRERSRSRPRCDRGADGPERRRVDAHDHGWAGRCDRPRDAAAAVATRQVGRLLLLPRPGHAVPGGALPRVRGDPDAIRRLPARAARLAIRQS